MTLSDLVKHANKLMAENPKASHAEIRLKQYDDIYHDTNGTVACDNIELDCYDKQVLIG